MVNVDWSQAPLGATHWSSREYGFFWLKKTEVQDGIGGKIIDFLVVCGDDYAPSFGAKKGKLITLENPE